VLSWRNGRRTGSRSQVEISNAGSSPVESIAGCGAEGARLLWEQKVIGSIPIARIGITRVVGRADLRGCLLNTSRLVQLLSSAWFLSMRM
jgi:hypothetical protein